MKKITTIIVLSTSLLSCSKQATQISDMAIDPHIYSRGGGGTTGGQFGPVAVGPLLDNLFVFTNGSVKAKWQGPSKGYIGDVVINGEVENERNSNSVAYSGMIVTNDFNLGAWQNIVDNNSGQAGGISNPTYVADMSAALENAFAQVNALPVTSGYESVDAMSLDGLNTMNGNQEVFVINITSGLSVMNRINITGDAGDLFIMRWDTDANFANGYNGQVKFQNGSGIIPNGGLTPASFLHVAGDINSANGGSNPPAPYPQGPRDNNGTGALINGGIDFSGGGFFTGYWLTTGKPTLSAPGVQPYGTTSSQSNSIFVGGWYSKTTKFSLSAGASGVYVQPNQ